MGLWRSRDLVAEDEARTVRALGSALVEKRAAVSSITEPQPWLVDVFGGGRSASGAAVNERTASTVPMVNACVGVLADLIATVPCKLYRPTGKGREEIVDHPAARLLSSDSTDLHTSHEMKQNAMSALGYSGRGFIRVFRDRHFQPAELQWVPSCEIRPEVLKMKDGRKRLRFLVVDERDPLTRSDLVYLRYGSGFFGMSPITALRETIGLSLTQREQVGRIYANGARFPGYFVSPQTVSKQQLEDFRSELNKTNVGTENAGRQPALWGGWDYKSTTGMSLADAEFLESRKFERGEIALLYRVPTSIFGDTDKTSSWGTGVEQMTLGFLQFCFNPWLTNWEHSLGCTLLTEEEKHEGLYFRFNRAALLQISLELQAKFLREMRDIGVYSVNDVRRRLEENDLPDHIGDDYRLPFNGAGGRPAEPASKPQPAAA